MVVLVVVLHDITVREDSVVDCRGKGYSEEVLGTQPVMIVFIVHLETMR